MAKYTLIHGSTQDDWKVFDANSLVEAREYAKSKGWDSTLVQPGDYRTYPGTGYPEKDWVTAAKESDTAVRGRTALETYGAGATDTGAATGGWTEAQTAQYNDYITTLNSGLYPNMPRVTSIDEWWKIQGDLNAHWEYYGSRVKATLTQYDEWIRFQAFRNQYGDLNDFSPKNFADYINNYAQSQQQLNAWTTEAGPEATGFTDAQIREYKDFLGYASRYGKPGDWWPVDVGDFFTNYQNAQQQLSSWKGLAGEEDKYALTPGEQARRREEAYGESRYAAQERYHEQPRYQEKFASWVKGQSDMSGALEQYVTGKYPSLRAQFESQISPLTGFETREQARAEATKRESGWQSWLAQRQPDTEQEYWGQRPQERGERMYMHQPTLRAVAW